MNVSLSKRHVAYAVMTFYGIFAAGSVSLAAYNMANTDWILGTGSDPGVIGACEEAKAAADAAMPTSTAEVEASCELKAGTYEFLANFYANNATGAEASSTYNYQNHCQQTAIYEWTFFPPGHNYVRTDAKVWEQARGYCIDPVIQTEEATGSASDTSLTTACAAAFTAFSNSREARMEVLANATHANRHKYTEQYVLKRPDTSGNYDYVTVSNTVPGPQNCLCLTRLDGSGIHDCSVTGYLTGYAQYINP